jgi:hypothetical protein
MAQSLVLNRKVASQVMGLKKLLVKPSNEPMAKIKGPRQR